MIYDDGSYDVTDESGTTYAVDTGGNATASIDRYGNYVQADARENAKMGQFYPPGKPWWESAAMLGMSRAIDAAFGPRAVDKTTATATYAGQNGKTYGIGKNASGGGASGNDSLIVLMIIGGLLFAASA